MNINHIKSIITRNASRTGLVLRKNSPGILTGVGIAGLVTSAVMASRATLQLEPVMAGIREGVLASRDRAVDGAYTEQEKAKDLAYTYTRGVMGLAKLYGPSVTLGLASIACIVGAHGIMKKRNAALVVAYNAVEKSFSEYRKRVVEALGPDNERELRIPTKTEEIEDPSTGKTRKTQHIDAASGSPYSRVFDYSSPQWSAHHDQNILFLLGQQRYANDLLKARGHVFLNDVYDSLGIERTSAGAVVGWVWQGDGDNYIDFGFDESVSMTGSATDGINFVDDRFIFLEFNVDGVVFDKLGDNG